ncbi:hypothetical protein Tco_1418589 [Tanacetum coccineum]
MFDELLNPLPYVDLHAPEVIAPIPKIVASEHVVSTGLPSSTTVDQDALITTYMQEELLNMMSDVWELVPPPDKALVYHS